MNVVIVNGKRYEVPSGSISVVNNKVYCNGELITDTSDFKEKNIHITVEGNVQGDVSSTSGDITINGSCRNVKATSGDIKITGNVSGNVCTTSGDIECGDIMGNVSTVSGDIIKRVKSFLKNIF